MNTQQIIRELNKLDLSTYPYQEAKKLIGGLGKIIVISETLFPGDRILRVRPQKPHQDFEKSFTELKELNYKLPHPKDKYKRASIPNSTTNSTMFYGSIVPKNLLPTELSASQITCAFEGSEFIRNINESGIQKLTYSKWIVTKKITLVAIVHYKDFIASSSYTNRLNQSFLRTINQYPKYINDTLLVSEFFAKQFAKSITDNDYEYLHSACFTETILKKDFGGVLYPSVRTEGKGFNVAIHPFYADNNIELEASLECFAFKNQDNLFINNNTVALVLKGQKTIDYKPILPQYKADLHTVIQNLV